eukprot:CAMPEP_0183808104 /NCGR_PEP_ID=MMETSP0803_2-20130417/42896_1 /TAXON_ID=195967 /ORGANISM="Crustomastix stigmata, Strain CCMP3273" /LENGTH=97 /DNA_ID=CAMNT_0026052891 /DNA_START=9 /DNA_END=298 /DNA_ORIENTATION=-
MASHAAGMRSQITALSTPWYAITASTTSWSVEPWWWTTSMCVSMPYTSRKACLNASLWKRFAASPTERISVPSTSNVTRVESGATAGSAPDAIAGEA